MKVVQIGSGWFPLRGDGLERYFSDLVRVLPGEEMEVRGLAYELKVDPNVAGLEALSFGTDAKPLLRKYRDQRRAILRQLCDNPDLVVSHCTPSTFPALSHIPRQRLVSHFHGPRYQERAMEGASRLSVLLSREIERRVFARTSRFIALSSYASGVLQTEYGVEAEKISVIPGGVDLNRFHVGISRQEARRHLRIEHAGPLLTTVRRLTQRTGLENLIEAMATVVRERPNVRLQIVGRGDLEGTLRRQIEKRQLRRNLFLTGFVSDDELPFFYRASNFTILPSVALEGFGLSSVESLASGVPVVGTPVGGIPEVLEPLSSSLLFAGTSPADLAGGILRALERSRELPSSTDCRAYAERNFSWPKIASRIAGVYKRQIERRAS